MAVYMGRLDVQRPALQLPPSVLLVHEFPSRRSLLESTQINAGLTRFRIPHASSVPTDNPVVCRLRIRGEADEVVVYGRVARASPDGKSLLGHLVEVEVEGGGRIAFARLHAQARGLPRHLGTRSGERVAVQLTGTASWQGRLAMVQIVDLSRRGLQLRFARPPPRPGTWVGVRVRPGILRQRSLMGRIVWAQGLAAGMEILEIDPADRAWVDDVVASGLRGSTLPP